MFSGSQLAPQNMLQASVRTGLQWPTGDNLPTQAWHRAWCGLSGADQVVAACREGLWLVAPGMVRFFDATSAQMVALRSVLGRELENNSGDML